MVTATAPEATLLPAALAALKAQMQRRRYAKGQIIMCAGEPEARLAIVERGAVLLVIASPEGREIVLAHVGAGEVFGDLALLDGGAAAVNVVAAEPTQLLLLPREAFLRLLVSHPDLAAELLAALSHRLRQDVETLQDVAFLDIPARLAKVLLRLAEAQGRATTEGYVLAARLTQRELAGMVGATRESVNKWLGCYERQGLIRRGDGTITLLRPNELQRRATTTLGAGERSPLVKQFTALV